MDEDSQPWPKLGDSLFKLTGDWWNIACLNIHPGNWYPYAEGYNRAANILVTYVEEHNRNQDFLVYPIVFLYRQYLELQLKLLIRDGSDLLDRSFDLLMHHDIRSLWNDCRSILESLWPDSPTSDLDAVQSCISELNVIDPKSMSFRYPVDKKGDAVVFPMNHINLKHVADVMSRLAGLLNACHMAIDHELEVRQEMRDYY